MVINKDKQVDQLTGILSVTSFERDVRELIDSHPDKVFAIVELDINRLTMINELYGLSEGDNLLRYMGSTLRDVLRDVEDSSCARIQADLFVFACPYDEKVIENIITLIEHSIRRYSLMLNIDILVSFGIYKCVKPELEVALMRDRAKMALKTVKGNYIKHFAYYDEKMHDKIVREQEITQNMNHALKNREFVVYFQPKHSLDDESIIGAEALVRWNSPQKGMISPGEFVPLFEENGFIMKIDTFVWEESCKFIRKSLDAGLPIKPVSVNVSRINLYNPELCEILNSLVKEYNIPYEMLELEFTESAYTDNPQLMLQTMNTLQQMGFKVEMDDFGSGYSSLNMLKDVPVDVLKIDLRFLDKSEDSEKATAIVSAVVRMAKWLGISSIIEGVETKEQISFLKSIGCTMVQGYYFSKPMPQDDYIEYIKKYSMIEKSGKQPHLDTAYVDISPDAFWKNVEEHENDLTALFSAYALYEMYDGVEETIRTSESYYELFHTNRNEHYENRGSSRLRVYEEDRPLVGAMLEQAGTGIGVGEAVFRRMCHDGSIVWIHAKAKLLGMNGKSKVFFVGLNDVSRYINSIPNM